MPDVDLCPTHRFPYPCPRCTYAHPRAQSPKRLVVGYVVLTKGPTGEWQPDWDGIVHTSHQDADAELIRAQESRGP